MVEMKKNVKKEMRAKERGERLRNDKETSPHKNENNIAIIYTIWTV